MLKWMTIKIKTLLLSSLYSFFLKMKTYHFIWPSCFFHIKSWHVCAFTTLVAQGMLRKQEMWQIFFSNLSTYVTQNYYLLRPMAWQKCILYEENNNFNIFSNIFLSHHDECATEIYTYLLDEYFTIHSKNVVWFLKTTKLIWCKMNLARVIAVTRLIKKSSVNSKISICLIIMALLSVKRSL